MLTTVKPAKILNNPSIEELREWARAEEIPTAYGAAAYKTKKAASRSANFTKMFMAAPAGKSQITTDEKNVREAEALLAKIMPQIKFIQIDRVIGRNERKQWHCRLLIPQKYARIALLWSQTLFEASSAQKDPAAKPDFLTIDIPQWPEEFQGVAAPFGERAIFVLPEQGRTYLFGTDYVGEVKMSFLRQSMYQMKMQGGLGLHAGSKKIRIKPSKTNGHAMSVMEAGVLLFGLSGTGKTTLTLEDHGLQSPEGVELLQDDIVWLTPDGKAYGTEDNFYVKTEGLSEATQPGIYRALFDPQTVFENVEINPKTKLPDFNDFSGGTTNCRALALRRKIKGSGEGINLDRVHAMFFITRRDTVVPPIARLNPEQAAAYFMLGESIETSAGDPTKAGQPKHEVGFNPFIIGPEADEGRRLLEIIKANKIQCYFLNTGAIGKGSDNGKAGGRKISQAVSSRLIEAAIRGSIVWSKDPHWGYEVPSDVPGVAGWSVDWNPKCYYSPELYAKLNQEILEERRSYLTQFSFKLPIG